MSKYVCGKCNKGFEDLQIFGGHTCIADNPALAAFGKVIRLGEYSIDFGATVEEAVEKQKVKATVQRLEDELRRGDLSA
jgi:hypothetical protein